MVAHSLDRCNHCHVKFTLLHRKRACGLCSLLFCSKCSKTKIKLEPHGDSVSRVCQGCLPQATSSLTKKSTPANLFIHARVWVPRGNFTHMLSFLNHHDLGQVMQTCRWWSTKASLDLVWKRLTKVTFFGNQEPRRQMEEQRHVSWKQIFACRWTREDLEQKKCRFEDMRTLILDLRLSPRYAEILAEEEIDLDSLGLLRGSDLRELGIPTGPRLKILHAAQNNSSAGKTTEPTPVEQESAQDIQQDKVSLVRRVQQSIVRIAVLTRDGALCNVGSGIIVHERGLLATARHCLVGEGFNCFSDETSDPHNPNYTILVAPTENASRPPLWKYRAKAFSSSKELDCALLWLEGEVLSDPPSGLYIGDVTSRTIIAREWTISNIPGSNFNNLDQLPPALPLGNSQNLEPGDDMWMFGYPSSGHNTITIHHAICSGTDSMVYEGREVGKAWLRTAAQLDNGFSGGAAVDRTGQLVGLISFSVLRQDRVRAIHLLRMFIARAQAERLTTCQI